MGSWFGLFWGCVHQPQTTPPFISKHNRIPVDLHYRPPPTTSHAGQKRSVIKPPTLGVGEPRPTTHITTDQGFSSSLLLQYITPRAAKRRQHSRRPAAAAAAAAAESATAPDSPYA